MANTTRGRERVNRVNRRSALARGGLPRLAGGCLALFLVVSLAQAQTPARPQVPADSWFWAVAKGGDVAQSEEGERPERELRADAPKPTAEDLAPAQLNVTTAPEEQIEEVVVTGSLIARDANLGALAPVQTLSIADFQSSGEFDLADALNDIPALLTSSTQNSTAGQSFRSLRALGAARTLTLVDGRRHVAGAAGTTAVDTSSIPDALIERVEVLTGGASSLYGADAVSGVVNFILKDDFEGLDFRLQGGTSVQRRDADSLKVSALWGKNFFDDRANITLSGVVQRREELRVSDRRGARGNRGRANVANPALRFQRGEIDAQRTPNFARFFAPDAPSPDFPVGARIPRSADQFSAAFMNQFMMAPQLTDAERALIDRAAKAPPRAFGRASTFSISSVPGIIRPKSFDNVPSVDSDGNGVDDCFDSSVGFNSTQIPLGGCFQVGRSGRVEPLRDGIVVSETNQLRGPGTPNALDEDFLTPRDDRYALNATGRFDLTESMTLFAEAKLAFNENKIGGPRNSFADLLEIRPDNPFIPQELSALATAADGLLVSRDTADLGRNFDSSERTTYRFVGGVKGDLGSGLNYEVSSTYGKFLNDDIDRNAVIQDRFFAAIDVVQGPDGKPVCRSELDPTALPPGSFSGLPAFSPGFFTFTPGTGKCKPANILAGRNSISREAVNFITTRDKTRTEINQFVVSGRLSGQFPDAVALQGGNIAFAAGVEFRDERSSTEFGPLVLGQIQANGANFQAGQLVKNVPGVTQKGLLFSPEVEIRNTGGSFNVEEAFAELQFPVLRDVPFAAELTLDTAARVSRYSTIGSTFTFTHGATYAPVSDLRFRTTLAEAVRAPNIGELFSPDQGVFFRPIDPCDQAQIDSLKQSGDPRGANREKNCRAAGIPEGFTDPLTAQFAGLSGGNRDLKEETGRTFTLGAVIQPRWIEGLSLSVDYFDIEIEDAIQAVGARDILEGCFDSGAFPANQFCSLFSRNMDPNSPTFRGLNFLRQTQINFAKLETSGVDFGLRYFFNWGQNDFGVSANLTRVDKVNQFFDPLDKSAKNPALGEAGVPDLAGNASFNWSRGGLAMSWQTQFIDEQVFGGVNAETVKQMFGPGKAIAGDVYIHDLSLSYSFGGESQSRYSFFAGINDVTAEGDGADGRFFFTGLRANF
jgi:iron complex outermembrane recepter protein